MRLEIEIDTDLDFEDVEAAIVQGVEWFMQAPSEFEHNRLAIISVTRIEPRSSQNAV